MLQFHFVPYIESKNYNFRTENIFKKNIYSTAIIGRSIFLNGIILSFS